MNTKHKLIAFAGRKRSGKGLLSNAICDTYIENNPKPIILTIANYLKELCCELLCVDFDTLIEWKDDNTKKFSIKPNERWFNLINKKTQIDINDIKSVIEGKTFTSIRQLLQIIGTDLIRKYQPEWHVNSLIKDIKENLEFRDVVIDDVRFPNEKKAIEELGGRVFFIIRPNWFYNITNHISETSLKWQDFKSEDIIINDLKAETMCINIQAAFIHIDNDAFVSQLPIFLSSNEHFRINCNSSFPNKNNEKLAKDILNQNLINVRFIEHGIIHYHSTNRKLIEEFKYEVLNSECRNWQRDYVIYNPLINENLKFFI